MVEKHLKSSGANDIVLVDSREPAAARERTIPVSVVSPGVVVQPLSGYESDAHQSCLPTVEARSILSPVSGFLATTGSDITHSLNAFIGCSHGNACCGEFCYADCMPQFNNRAFAKAVVKVSAVPLYQKQYDAIKRPRRGQAKRLAIFMSSVTDPYIPQERTLRITEKLLFAMIERPPDKLVIQTHATLVERDLDLIVALSQRCMVMLSISVETDMERVPGLRPHASSPARRIEVLRAFRDAGVLTQAAVSPLLPLADPEAFTRKLEAAAHRVLLDHWLIGDGSKGGRRTRAKGFPDKLAANGFGVWNTLEKFREVEAIVRRLFAPDRIFVSAAGFTQVGVPLSLTPGAG